MQQSLLNQEPPVALTLRQYQEDAIHNLKCGLRDGYRRQVLMLATGGGKTLIASRIMQGAAQKGKRACFIVDSIELVEQTYFRFTQDGLWTGIIQADHENTNWAAPIQVATIQSLRARWPHMSDEYRFDLIVIDECHVLHRAHVNIIDEANVPVIGLSATPFRKGLGDHFNRLVVGATTQSLTDDKFLVPADIYVGRTPDMSGVKKKTDGDWDADSAGDAMSSNEIIGDVVANWIKYGEDRKTLVFACNVAHSQKITEEFRKSDIEAAHVDGYMDKGERAIIIQRFREGKIKVLCNCAVLTKGFDVPDVSCIILARPTKSLMLHIQMIGRGLRIAPGKIDCIILDNAGNCDRNGIPTDKLPDVLHVSGNDENPDRKKREKEEAVPKACASCGFMKPVRVRECPKCGFTPAIQSDVEEVQGELVRVNKKDAKKTPEYKKKIYAELLWYATDQNYNPGWAYHKCKEICGSTPRDTKSIQPVPPEISTLRMIKHLQIKYAKRKDKREEKI